ncbi:3,4-dihydroxy-2-butanone-4-phosphate synthase [Nocardioides jishulii]|uniref:3,4-dihydroxy-2-butanone 4-phosphate synthase n=1 Tax=Nocardioides jishulii TaxID=2575440 RepID=A0A4U2YLT2_9ACTN|nr:3,4-dihydroxy-2-butanone-4-phosphate synthase [Nocardioides jishulii]TKI62176.1 3,4-dihydroxy-2-butanone-4-phosphate synthase [Nocardioides jishulii]
MTTDLKTPERVRAESELAPIEDVIREIGAGRMVVLVDDEDRENEGDLVMAAECVTPEAVNFMITHGKGLLCLPMTAERARELDLPPMVTKNEDDFGTAFTVSIDATCDHGVTTGISARDRATTIVLAATTATSSDLNRPGHVFPLIAHPAGTLGRTGHTEAAVDLAVLAGLAPMGAIVEIVGDDGEMLRLPQLLPWAARHGFLVSTIERLRAHRLNMAVSA